jgi:hypothetical protein
VFEGCVRAAKKFIAETLPSSGVSSAARNADLLKETTYSITPSLRRKW